MPVTIKFDNTTQCPQQAWIIPNATCKNDGVMSKEQACQLQALVEGGGCGLYDQCFTGPPLTSDANPGIIFSFTPDVPTDRQGSFTFEYIVQSYAPEDAACKTRRKAAIYNFDPESGLFFVEEKEIYNVGTNGAGTVPDSSTSDNIKIDINGAAGGGDPARVLIWEVHVEGRFSPAAA